MKILIAEDEFTTRMMVQVCLEGWGYRVESVVDGREALDVLNKPDAPHIAILDWEMPEINGVEVCRKLKENNPEDPPYVILLTARDSKQDILEGFAAGADDYMTKPFDDNELRARVRVAERLVRTQSSLSESVAELRDALNQLEALNSSIAVCGSCKKIYNEEEGTWHSFDEILGYGADSRFFTENCPACRRD